MAAAMMYESIWFDRSKFEGGEAHYNKIVAGTMDGSPKKEGHKKEATLGSVKEIANARRKIQHTLKTAPGGTAIATDGKRIAQLEENNQQLRKEIEDLKARMKRFEAIVAKLEIGSGDAPKPTSEVKEEKKQEVEEEDDDDEDSDDDIDLFGSEDEEEAKETERLKQERIAKYAEKKAKKPQLIAKSNIILDIKPWDDETDLKEMERIVRSVTLDGLLWGASKLVPVAYGVQKLQISCVVEDEKVGTDLLEESITQFEDFVQSVDVAAFNKV